jgi:hypothetical protein
VSYRSLVKALYDEDFPAGTQCRLIPQIHTIQQHKRKICAVIGKDWIDVDDSVGMMLLSEGQMRERQDARNRAYSFEENERISELEADPESASLGSSRMSSDRVVDEKAVAKKGAIVPASRKRSTQWENTRSLDFDAFLDRLKPMYGPKGFVTIAHPAIRPGADDDFPFRLYRTLKKAGWPVNEYSGKKHFDVSTYGVTLGAVPDEDGRFPPHFYTLRYALEKSGLPLHLLSLPSERADEGVSIIVGPEYP